MNKKVALSILICFSLFCCGCNGCIRPEVHVHVPPVDTSKIEKKVEEAVKSAKDAADVARTATEKAEQISNKAIEQTKKEGKAINILFGKD